jgi:hypothetical protein
MGRYGGPRARSACKPYKTPLLRVQLAYNLGMDPLKYRGFQGTLVVVALQASFTNYSM